MDHELHAAGGLGRVCVASPYKVSYAVYTGVAIGDNASIHPLTSFLSPRLERLLGFCLYCVL